LSLVELDPNHVPDEAKDQNEEDMLKAFKELELANQKRLNGKIENPPMTSK
jgi:hypothetical protein